MTIRRQRRPHDRLVERAEEQGEQDRAEDLEAGAAARARSPGAALRRGPSRRPGYLPSSGRCLLYWVRRLLARRARSAGRDGAEHPAASRPLDCGLGARPAATARTWSSMSGSRSCSTSSARHPSCSSTVCRPRSVMRASTTRRSSDVADALDEAALLHPVDEPGGIRDADPEPVREPAHRQGSMLLQDPEDLEVAEADPAVVHRPGARAAPMARQRGDTLGDLAEDVLASRGRPRRNRLRSPEQCRLSQRTRQTRDPGA